MPATNIMSTPITEDAAIAERLAPPDLTGDEGEARPRTDDARPIAGPMKRLTRRPLLPEAGAGGLPLTAVIAIMSFLAVLALAGFLAIAAASSAWTDELKSAFTVQIKGPDAETIEARTKEAARILSTTPGVLDAAVIESDEAAKLLEPWLGGGDVNAYLTVPAMIDIRIDRNASFDLELLRARLDAAAPGAVLDDHGQWHSRLSAAAGSGQALAFAIFVMVMGAACAISIFAARAGLAANDDVVSLLHLIGATDGFVANEVQRRFVVLALRGCLTGLAAAVAVLALANMAGDANGAGYFLPQTDFASWRAILLLAAPIGICIVTALSARWTVIRTLKDAY